MGQEASVMQPTDLSTKDKAAVWYRGKTGAVPSTRRASPASKPLPSGVDSLDVNAVSKLIASGKAKRIVVAAGAGMSVAAGKNATCSCGGGGGGGGGGVLL